MMARAYFLTVGLAFILLALPDVVAWAERLHQDTFTSACAVGLIAWGLVVLGVHKYKRERKGR